MQIRRYIFLFAAIVVALLALALWYGKKKPVETSPTAAVETNVVPPAATAPSAPVVNAPVDTNALAAKVAAATTTPEPAGEDKSQRMREILSVANDVPIVFYGRLED